LQKIDTVWHDVTIFKKYLIHNETNE